MTTLFSKNKKIAASSDNNHTVYNFGIPAFKSKLGIKTCPMAGTCAKGCYAQQGAYVWNNVAQAFENRLQATLKADFVSNVCTQLATYQKTAKRQNKQLVIRVHDSGDFYSPQYAHKWFDIARSNPDIKFYAYTKMIPMIRLFKSRGIIPSNFTIIYSEGGLADQLIESTDRHSRVFDSLDALHAAGYADATKNDLVAIGDNPKIGLVYHGAKSKQWTTAS